MRTGFYSGVMESGPVIFGSLRNGVEPSSSAVFEIQPEWNYLVPFDIVGLGVVILSNSVIDLFGMEIWIVGSILPSMKRLDLNKTHSQSPLLGSEGHEQEHLSRLRRQPTIQS